MNPVINDSTVAVTNIKDNERLVSIFGGALLLFDGLFNKNFRLLKLGVGAALLSRGVTGRSLLYDLAGRPSSPPSRNINIRTEFFVNRPVNEVYAAWRKLENLPHFMKHIQSVKEVYDNISEWEATIAGSPVPLKWRACIVRDEPNRFLSWRSLPDSAIQTAGRVNFVPLEEEWGTNLQITITYQPTNLLTSALAEFFNPALEKMIRQDLNGFKNYIEGDVAENAVF